MDLLLFLGRSTHTLNMKIQECGCKNTKRNGDDYDDTNESPYSFKESNLETESCRMTPKSNSWNTTIDNSSCRSNDSVCEL